MSQALSPSLLAVTGLARVARVWKISRAGVYRVSQRNAAEARAPRRRPGPVGAFRTRNWQTMSRRQIDASRLHGEGYRN